MGHQTLESRSRDGGLRGRFTNLFSMKRVIKAKIRILVFLLFVHGGIASAQTQNSELLPSVAQSETDSDLYLDGNSQTQTVDGEGLNVYVSGSKNTIVITGNCVELGVSGRHNRVLVDSSSEIIVTGIDNKVIYKTGEPSVLKSGRQNTVEIGE